MAEERNTDIEKQTRSQWLVWMFTALTVLIFVFGLAFLLSGKEVIERPLLVASLLLAWLGTLAGIALGREAD